MTGLSWSSTTCLVLPASRSSSVSPTQRMTESPASIAARVLSATSLDVSWKSVRRSEWPIPQGIVPVSADDTYGCGVLTQNDIRDARVSKLCGTVIDEIQDVKDFREYRRPEGTWSRQ